MTPANDNQPRPSWFDALLLKYEPFMRVKCGRIAGALDPDEVYQEAAILCLRKWRLYDPTRDDANFVAWLGFICREAAAQIRRKSKKGESVEFNEKYTDARHADQWTLADANRLLAFCNPEQREAIDMAAAGYSYEEIGAVVGVTKQGVQLRILAGREIIKSKMRQADVVASVCGAVAANDNVKVGNAAA